MFLLLILPLLVLLIGVLTAVYNAWYFVLAIAWFGLGLVFFISIEG